MQTLGQQLKLLRADKNIMQKDIAELLNVSIRSYQYYEKGTLEPNITNLKRLADYFNVSLDYLVGRNFPFDESTTQPPVER